MTWLIVSKLTCLLFFGRVNTSSVKAAILILSSRIWELDLSVGLGVIKVNLLPYVCAQLGLEVFSVFVEFLDISPVEGFHQHDQVGILGVLEALENLELKLES